MSSFDKERQALVYALFSAINGVPGRLSEVIRNIPTAVWDWNLFDEAVIRAEILFDGEFVSPPTLPAIPVDELVYNQLERNEGDYVRLGDVACFYRLKLIRQCSVDTAIKVFMRIHDCSLEDAIEMLCAYVLDAAGSEMFDDGGRTTRIECTIRELLNVSVIPQPYAELIRDQLGAPTHNVQRRRLEKAVQTAETNLQNAKNALADFKGK